MNDKAMKIGMILDRSGSMSVIEAATVEGMNSFLEKQKQTPIDVSLVLVQFDDVCEEIYRGPVATAPVFTLDDKPGPGKLRFSPRGMTAFYDAVGSTIDIIGQELREMSEADRPSKVVIVIMTDGVENASKHYALDDIARMIKRQRETYNWEFQYLAANLDAVGTAAKINIPAQNAVRYSASNVGTQSVMDAVSRNVSSYGVTGQSVNMTYSAEDRAKAMMDDGDNQLLQDLNKAKVKKRGEPVKQ